MRYLNTKALEAILANPCHLQLYLSLRGTIRPSHECDSQTCVTDIRSHLPNNWVFCPKLSSGITSRQDNVDYWAKQSWFAL